MDVAHQAQLRAEARPPLEALATAGVPLLEALATAGVPVLRVSDPYNRRLPNRRAIPLLLEWRPRAARQALIIRLGSLGDRGRCQCWLGCWTMPT